MTNRVRVPLEVGLILTAFISGWHVHSYFQRPNPVTADISQTQQAPKQAITAVDIYSGTGMNPDELYKELDTLSGVDFDKRYINYVILMQSYMEGINRLAKEKSVAAAFKTKATELWSFDSGRLSELFLLQKQVGYSHH